MKGTNVYSIDFHEWVSSSIITWQANLLTYEFLLKFFSLLEIPIVKLTHPSFFSFFLFLPNLETNPAFESNRQAILDVLSSIHMFLKICIQHNHIGSVFSLKIKGFTNQITEELRDKTLV